MTDTRTPPVPDPNDRRTDVSAWPTDLAGWNERGLGALATTMGITLLEVSPERLVATMPVQGNTQPYGLLHGGASAALAETLGSIGAGVHAGPGRIPVGIELNATHHASARSGVVTAVATALTRGRTLASYEIVVSEDSGRRLCTARLTALLRDAPGA